MARWVKVAEVAQFTPGRGLTVWVNERDLALYLHQGQVYALGNKCPHRGGQLADGHITADGNVICPLHSWDFEVKTGVSRYDNQDNVPVYPVRVVDGAVEVVSDAGLIVREGDADALRTQLARLCDEDGRASAHTSPGQGWPTLRSVPIARC
jgi:nitrite reductase (NADH) small subunit